MGIVTIVLFLLYCWGFGYSLTRFIKCTGLEALSIRIGVGLGAIPVIGTILHCFRIPLNWWLFLLLAMLIPIVDLARNIPISLIRNSRWNGYIKNLRIKGFIHRPQKHALILLAIFAVNLIIYCSGPFIYPWLEDDDSWAHAASIKYIAIEKTINAPEKEFQYLNPYPPGYGLVFGILHQTSPSLYWTLKFFNGFIVALGILFFYYFAKIFSGDKTKALWATFFLTIIPCYLSHFIWAHSLTVTLFFPALYLLLKTQNNKKFILPATIVIAGIFLTQPTQALKFVILSGLLFLATVVAEKKFNWALILSFLLAGLISLLWWGPVFKNMRSGDSKIILRVGNKITEHKEKTTTVAKRLFDPAGGSATRKYTARDYVNPSLYNQINNPVGVGAVLCLLAFVGLARCAELVTDGNKKEKTYGLTVLWWLLFTFLGMNSKTFHLPIGLVAFRFWTLFAIPVCFLAAEQSHFIKETFPKTPRKPLLLGLLIIGALITSGFHKLNVNMSIWPRGLYWPSRDELKGHVWMRDNIKKNTRVFCFADNMLVIGNDMRADFWSEKYKDSFKNAIDMDVNTLYAALKENHFEYIVIGRRDALKLGLKKINKQIRTIDKSELFEFVYTHEGGEIFIAKIL